MYIVKYTILNMKTNLIIILKYSSEYGLLKIKEKFFLKCGLYSDEIKFNSQKLKFIFTVFLLFVIGNVLK